MTALDRKDREREFHDRRFREGLGRRQGMESAYRLLLPVNMRYHQDMDVYRGGGRVLEYGCGNGENALTFARRGVDITGIDISWSGVAHAQAQADKVGLRTRFEVMDAEHLAFSSDTFSAVFGKGILHHLNLDRALAEVARVLLPEGRAVFLEPLGHNPLINCYRRLTPEARTSDERPLRLPDLERIQAYFGSVHLCFYNLTTLLALPFRDPAVFGRVFDWCSRLDEWLLASFGCFGPYCWTVYMDLRRPLKQTSR